jgi:hypothetical protein
MDIFTHTIIATGCIGIAYAVGRYFRNGVAAEMMVSVLLDRMEKDGFIKCKLDSDGEKELVKISEIIANHTNGT